VLGRAGTFSTRAGGGGNGTSASAEDG